MFAKSYWIIKPGHQADQILARGGAQRFELGKAGITQGDEPCDFNLHAAVHIALLAHGGAQGRDFAGVATI